MKFRTDINALRAFALISVVIFHFYPTSLPGGFVGVDVFFVISGFLMTSIIVRGINEDNFSFWKFYSARIKRIFPALTALCAVLLVFGWFFLMPSDYETLSNHARDSLGFFSNFTYSDEAGYFDSDSKTKWLLHTWSLSVEWQFYIVYPILLVRLNRTIGKRMLPLAIVGLFCSSFFYCVYLTNANPSSSYYLISSRAWEMLFGSLAYFFPISRYQKQSALLGLLLIASSIAFIDSNSLFPGYIAFIPTFGAYLIISSGWLSERKRLSHPVIQNLGLWSYSIYLWHWPIVVGLNYYFVSDPVWLVSGFLLSIFLGFVSFTIVEKPSSSFKYNALFSSVNIAVAASVLVFVLSSSVMNSEGVFDRGFVKRNEHVLEYEKDLIQQLKSQKKKGRYGECWVPGGADVYEHINECKTEKRSDQLYDVLLIGDSHAAQYYHALKVTFPYVNFHLMAANSCSLVGNAVDVSRKACVQEMKYLRNNYHEYDFVILSIFGPGKDKDRNAKFKLLYDLSDRLSDNVIVMGGLPRITPKLVDIYTRKPGLLSDSDFMSKFSFTPESPIGKRKFTFIDVKSYFSILTDGIPSIIDASHLSNDASLNLIKKLALEFPFSIRHKHPEHFQ